MQKLTSWLLGLKPKLWTILHMKHMNKILLTPTHCCRSVLLTQAQTEQLRHPLERNSCLGNILPVSHHEEGRQTGEVQGEQGQEDLQAASFPLCLLFQQVAEEECRQVKDQLSGIQ